MSNTLSYKDFNFSQASSWQTKAKTHENKFNLVLSPSRKKPNPVSIDKMHVLCSFGRLLCIFNLRSTPFTILLVPVGPGKSALHQLRFTSLVVSFFRVKNWCLFKLQKWFGATFLDPPPIAQTSHSFHSFHLKDPGQLFLSCFHMATFAILDMGRSWGILTSKIPLNGCELH